MSSKLRRCVVAVSRVVGGVSQRKLEAQASTYQRSTEAATASTTGSAGEPQQRPPAGAQHETSMSIELALLGGALGFCGVGFAVEAATTALMRLVAAGVAVTFGAAAVILLFGFLGRVVLRVKVALLLIALAVILGAGAGSFAAIAVGQPSLTAARPTDPSPQLARHSSGTPPADPRVPVTRVHRRST